MWNETKLNNIFLLENYSSCIVPLTTFYCLTLALGILQKGTLWHFEAHVQYIVLMTSWKHKTVILKNKFLCGKEYGLVLDLIYPCHAYIEDFIGMSIYGIHIGSGTKNAPFYYKNFIAES